MIINHFYMCLEFQWQTEGFFLENQSLYLWSLQIINNTYLFIYIFLLWVEMDSSKQVVYTRLIRNDLCHFLIYLYMIYLHTYTYTYIKTLEYDFLCTFLDKSVYTAEQRHTGLQVGTETWGVQTLSAVAGDHEMRGQFQIVGLNVVLL